MYKLDISAYDNTDKQFDIVKKLCKETLGYTEQDVQILAEKHFNGVIVKNLNIEQAKCIAEIFGDNDIIICLEDQRTDEIIAWKRDLGIELVTHPPKSHYCDEPLVSREHLVNPSTQHELEYQSRVQKAKSEKVMQDIEQQQHIPKCPTCKSTNIKKIGTGERVTSVAMFGLFSKKINKSFKCKNCGYTW